MKDVPIDVPCHSVHCESVAKKAHYVKRVVDSFLEATSMLEWKVGKGCPLHRRSTTFMAFLICPNTHRENAIYIGKGAVKSTESEIKEGLNGRRLLDLFGSE